MGATRKLRNAPIVEAVFDVDCDLPSNFNLEALREKALEFFRDRYPTSRTLHLQEHRIEAQLGASLTASTSRLSVQALQFLQADEKQLVQVRSQGFSFNRLAPYASLDEYLPEIERAWGLYAKLAQPIHIRTIRLRYINRIQLPIDRGNVDLDKFFRVGPRLPDEDRLLLNSFLIKHGAVDGETDNRVSILYV